MSGYAPLIGGLVGAFVGSFFGATAIGFAVGSMLGGALFPSTVEGPKLSDLHLQGSSYGAPIPIVYGTIRTAGNVIWQTQLSPHEHTSGGKGGVGGPQQKTTSYSASFDICLCESRGDHSLGRVWWNGRLVGDYRAGASEVGELPLVFYDGNAAQGADPTEEGIIGVGLVPAYRGVARVVLTDMDLSPGGNAIGNWNFEIISGQITDCPVHSVLEGDLSDTWSHANSWFPLVVDWPDPNFEPSLVKTYDSETIFEHGSFVTSPAWQISLTKGPLYTISIDGVKLTRPTWVYTAAQFKAGNDYNGPVLWGTYPYFTVGGVGCTGGVSVDVGQWSVSGQRKAYTAEDATVQSASGNTCVGVPAHKDIALNGLVGIPDDLYVHGLVGTPDTKRLFVLTGTMPIGTDPSIDQWWELIDGKLSRSGTVDPPLAFANFGFLHASHDAGSACSMAENNGQYIWSYTGAAGNEGLHCYKIDAERNLAQICTTKQLTTNPGGGEGFSASTIWTFSGGRCGVARYQKFEIFQRYASDAISTVTLAEIAADICTRDGMTADQYDVTDIEPIIVRGDILNSIPTTGRAALEAILPAFYVDAVESDGKIKFVRRGKDSLITIPDADLAAHTDGESLPDKLQIIRGQDEDLPAHIILNYINAGSDYLVGTQQWRRMTGGSKVVRTANLALVLTDAEAKRIVETWGAIAWDERDSYAWQTTRKYIAYEPTDVVTVQGIDLRITNKTEGMNGVIKWEGKRSRRGAFAQPGIGGAGGSTPGEIVAAQDTDLLLLDIPLITDPAKQQVYYAAMAGADRTTWAGATLFKSIDAGASYQSLLADSGPRDTFGVTSDVLGDFDGGCLFDEENSVTVIITPGGGQLDSVGRTAVLNGAGLYLVGDEIIAAKNAVLTDTRTYVLSGLLRGLYGTDRSYPDRPMATHVMGERMVALPVTTTIDAVWAEYNAPRKYRAITAGSPLPAGTGTGGGTGAFAVTKTIDMGAWGHHEVFTRDNGGFGPNDVIAIKFTTGTGPSITANMPRIAGAEFPSTGGTVNRIWALSDTPGDFVGLPYFAAKGTSSAITVPFTVNNDQNQIYFPKLAPLTAYYLNVKNDPASNVQGDAGMYFELTIQGSP